MFRFCLIILVGMLALDSVAMAQSHPTIRTGRPGLSIGPYTVGSDYFQIQSGLDRVWEKSEFSTDVYLLNTVLRYGLSEPFELSAVVNYQSDRSTDPAVNPVDGVSSVQLGFRYNLIDRAKGWVPGVGIQTRFKMTTVTKAFRADHLAPVFVLATQHQLAEGWAWGHNLGIAYDGTTPVPRYLLISNLSFPIVGKWGGFIEAYGDIKGGVSSAILDSGLSYLVNDDFQLDASGGWGSGRDGSQTFVSLGLSWRVHTEATRK